MQSFSSPVPSSSLAQSPKFNKRPKRLLEHYLQYSRIYVSLKNRKNEVVRCFSFRRIISALPLTYPLPPSLPQNTVNASSTTRHPHPSPQTCCELQFSIQSGLIGNRSAWNGFKNLRFLNSFLFLVLVSVRSFRVIEKNVAKRRYFHKVLLSIWVTLLHYFLPVGCCRLSTADQKFMLFFRGQLIPCILSDEGLETSSAY